MQDWQLTEGIAVAVVPIYKVTVALEYPSGENYETRPLQVAVESFDEDGVTRYQAVWTADRLVFGFGDTKEDALLDMANFLINDLESLEESEAGDGLTPKAAARLASLRALFGISH